MGPTDRQLGVVKFYNPRKGYGFITRADGNDVFFHLTHFRDRSSVAPVPGNAVQFALGQNREGPTAEDIVILPAPEVECYGGTITDLTPEGGTITTDDNFTIGFSRADYLPHTRADSLRIGDEVEMNFVAQGEDDVWRAKVVRAVDFDPDSQAARPERHEGDEEEENRRLLGILYKTDLDEEALHAGSVLTERNMRATLSALVSRVFDRRLEPTTRLALVQLVPQVYFDDECQQFLEAVAMQLHGAVDEETGETSPCAVRTLELLFDDELFPIRWSQYLLPFGLSLTRNLIHVPSCHARLGAPEMGEAVERWFTRVCRHVEQRRSGFGYVLTTALSTLDEMWQREVLRGALERILARLLLAVGSEDLATQVYHLRDKLSTPFLPTFLRYLSQHPDLAEALRAPTQAEIVSQWLEALLRGSDDELTPELLATMLPVVEEIRAHLVDDAAVSRLMQPLTDTLTPAEIVRMLATEDLPERSVWACLRHLDRQGELAGLLADPEVRGVLTKWLKGVSEAPHQALEREQEVNTALKLVESLRSSQELWGELAGIGQNLFAEIHERFARAGSEELLDLLEGFQLEQLPGLTPVLGARLADDSLSDVARRRLLAHFTELGPPLDDLAAAYLSWSRQPEQVALVNDLITALETSAATGDAEAESLAEVARAQLVGDGIAWQDGFVVALHDLPGGGRGASLEGFPVVLPQRLFHDPIDFAINRFVRLLHRRGMALGVARAPVPESGTTLGRLVGPLAVDERNAIVGTLLDQHGESCYFEAAEVVSGHDRALQVGALMRFTRVAATAGQPHSHVAFNIHADFLESDLPLLLSAFASGEDDEVAAKSLAAALALETETVAEPWESAWNTASEARREYAMETLSETARARLGELGLGT